MNNPELSKMVEQLLLDHASRKIQTYPDNKSYTDNCYEITEECFGNEEYETFLERLGRIVSSVEVITYNPNSYSFLMEFVIDKHFVIRIIFNKLAIIFRDIEDETNNMVYFLLFDNNKYFKHYEHIKTHNAKPFTDDELMIELIEFLEDYFLC